MQLYILLDLSCRCIAIRHECCRFPGFKVQPTERLFGGGGGVRLFMHAVCIHVVLWCLLRIVPTDSAENFWSIFSSLATPLSFDPYTEYEKLSLCVCVCVSFSDWDKMFAALMRRVQKPSCTCIMYTHSHPHYALFCIALHSFLFAQIPQRTSTVFKPWLTCKKKSSNLSICLRRQLYKVKLGEIWLGPPVCCVGSSLPCVLVHCCTCVSYKISNRNMHCYGNRDET